MAGAKDEPPRRQERQGDRWSGERLPEKVNGDARSGSLSKGRGVGFGHQKPGGATVLFWCRNNSAAMFERSIGARCQPGQVSSISISISISVFFPTADLAFAGMGWMAPVGLLTTRPRRSGYHLPIAVWWTFPDNDSTTERTFRRLRYRPGCCFFSSAAWKTGSIKKYGFFVIACSI